MKERVLDFKVYLPQLESEPGRFKGGVKRYLIHKNEDSAALVLGGSLLRVPSDVHSYIHSHNQSPSTDSLRIPRKQNYSMSPIKTYTNPIQAKSPARYVYNDPLHNNYTDLMKHPAFVQPKYTKQNPKKQIFNPIVGYTDLYKSTQQESKLTNLGNNGSRILESANKLKLNM